MCVMIQYMNIFFLIDTIHYFKIQLTLKQQLYEQNINVFNIDKTLNFIHFDLFDGKMEYSQYFAWLFDRLFLIVPS